MNLSPKCCVCGKKPVVLLCACGKHCMCEKHARQKFAGKEYKEVKE